MREAGIEARVSRAIGSPTFEQHVLELACRACTSDKAVLMRHQPPEQGGVNGVVLCGPYMSEADIERYHREFAPINPYARHMARMLPGRAHSTDDVMSVREYRKHPYFSWAERTFGAYELGGVVGQEGAHLLTIGICRRLRQGTFSHQQRTMMQHVMQSVRPAWFTHRRLHAAGDIDARDLRALVHQALVHQACFALDSRGRLVECNAAGEALFVHDDIVARRDRSIAFTAARAQARYLAILGGRSKDNLIPLDDNQGAPAMATLVRSPATVQASTHAAAVRTSPMLGNACWLLFVPASAAVRTRLRLAAFAARHALSASESALLERLVHGHTLDTIAQDLRQPLETCRSRLKQLLRKTGCSRQAELVIRVLA